MYTRGVCLLGLLFTWGACVAAADPQAIGQIKNVSGEAQVIRAEEVLSASLGTLVRNGDLVRTGADGAIGITFADNSRFSIGPGSEVLLENFEFDSTTHEGRFQSRLNRGTLTGVSGKLVAQQPESMTVETPTALLGVRGTTFLIRTGASDD